MHWSVLDSEVFVILAVVLLVAFDIFLECISPHAGDYTFSSIISNWSKSTPIISYALGVLSGHWFWHRAVSIIPQPGAGITLGWTGIVVALLGLGLRTAGITLAPWINLLIMGVGIVTGHFLFSL